VRQFLGGYGQDGSLDPRAAVYLKLGTPNNIRFLRAPSNEGERHDPEKATLDDFAFFMDTKDSQSLPVGKMAGPGGKLSSRSYVPSSAVPSAQLPGNAQLGVGSQKGSTYRFPGSRTFTMEGKYQHHMARHSRGRTWNPEPVLETWTYGHGGFPLFPHDYSDGVPLAFEFFFDPEVGRYVLREVKNVVEDEDSALNPGDPG
jgi:hypothetical protein